MNEQDARRWPYTVLGPPQAFIGIGGVPAGLIFILDPSGSGMGFSPELLEPTFLSSYLIPGLFLFAINGVATLIGAVMSFRRHPRAGELGVALGILLIGWIIVQVAMIGLVRWLQTHYFVVGGVELVLGWLVARRR